MKITPGGIPPERSVGKQEPVTAAGRGQFDKAVQGRSVAGGTGPQAAESPLTAQLRTLVAGIDLKGAGAEREVLGRFVDWTIAEQFGDVAPDSPGIERLKSDIMASLQDDPTLGTAIRSIIEEI